MNKADIVNQIQEQTALSREESGRTLAAIVDCIIEELASGNGDVVLTGFGTFTVKQRPARVGRNPSTGQPITIPASRSPTFKAGAVLKRAVAGR
ncbi:HU family DNA-binding protein [Pseudomonas sp. EMN2]|uniref:HU family DNA-binding protein n=1 Tax=Pseudomonas sp. EMN2 TaxID=2615212 RepID=UPI00129A494E|nr:HU family DNA-binding protein [Pseudomonas sp. EMN2]